MLAYRKRIPMLDAESSLSVPSIVEWIRQRFEGVVIKEAYSELTLFYNPNYALPNGVYFLTIKEKDGPNDKSSRLDREGVFRISFKPDPMTYQKQFGDKPRRSENAVAGTATDYSLLDTWLPHPIYAWMGWTMILNPSKNSLNELYPHIEESYLQAKQRFLERVGSES
jgi:hypothetical protein